jgi:uncharacterized protein
VRSVSTLEYALSYFAADNILPFNLSLHGGEVTAIPSATMSSLFDLISEHYLTHFDELMANGFRKQSPHIKTTLFNFDKHEALLRQYQVSISGSVDLPLSLHDKYRTTKKGKSTLARIQNNIELLGQYPFSKKLSATMFSEHFAHTSEIIDDIWFINNELKFDMNNFNFMFGFESALNDDKFRIGSAMDTQSLADELQVSFYESMKDAFLGTELEWGFKRNWFDEFTPSYCTSATNCGERFFLLQSNGDVYSCVRGQGSERFYYGNIFKIPARTLLENGKHKIRSVHQNKGLHEDCEQCDYLRSCNTGCAYVKQEKGTRKSYTCALQKEIYKHYPQQYPAPKSESEKALYLNNYVAEIYPHSIKRLNAQPEVPDLAMKLSSDFYDEKNTLGHIIRQDAQLTELYSSESFVCQINDDFGSLKSQILKIDRSHFFIDSDDSVILHVRKSMFDASCEDPHTNTLFIQLLRDTKVVYGDEQREKQEHLVTHQIYRNQLQASTKGLEWLQLNISPLLQLWQDHFLPEVLNNLFFTTSALRDYHYKKQQKNAFYHVQAVNLPFQNIEFFWCNSES